MKITYDGRDYELDKDAIVVDEWRQLKRKYQMTPKQFDAGVDEADPDSYTFLYWVMLRQAGDTRTPLNDDLKPDIIALNHALALAAEAEKAAEPEEEADPTPAASRPDGVTPPGSGSTTGTSATSATSTSSPSPKSADSAPPKSGG